MVKQNFFGWLRKVWFAWLIFLVLGLAIAWRLALPPVGPVVDRLNNVLPELLVELPFDSDQSTLNIPLEVNMAEEFSGQVVIADISNYLFNFPESRNYYMKVDSFVLPLSVDLQGPGEYYGEISLLFADTGKEYLLPVRIRYFWESSLSNSLTSNSDLQRLTYDLLDILAFTNDDVCQPLVTGCEFAFELNLPAFVQLRIFRNGQQVAVVWQDEELVMQEQYQQTLLWDGLVQNGDVAESGLYQYVIDAYHPRYGVASVASEFVVSTPRRINARNLLTDFSADREWGYRVTEPANVLFYTESAAGEIVQVVDKRYAQPGEIYQGTFLPVSEPGRVRYIIVAESDMGQREIAQGEFLVVSPDAGLGRWFGLEEKDLWQLGSATMAERSLALLQPVKLFSYVSSENPFLAVQGLSTSNQTISLELTDGSTQRLRAEVANTFGWFSEKLRARKQLVTGLWRISARVDNDLDESLLVVNQAGFVRQAQIESAKLALDVAAESETADRLSGTNKGLTIVLAATENDDAQVTYQAALEIIPVAFAMDWSSSLFADLGLSSSFVPKSLESELLVLLASRVQPLADGVLPTSLLEQSVIDAVRDNLDQPIARADFYRIFWEALLQQDPAMESMLLDRNPNETCFADQLRSVDAVYAQAVCEYLLDDLDFAQQFFADGRFNPEASVTFAELFAVLAVAEHKGWW